MKIKGAVLTALLEFVGKEFGEDAKSEWLANLDEETRDILDRVFASSWYSDEILMKSATAAFERFAPGEVPKAMRKLGAYGAKQQLTGIYRVLLRIGSPNLMITTAQKIWRVLNSEGTMTVVVNEPGRAILRISEVGTQDLFWAEIVAGWIERGLELTGGEDRKVVVTKIPKEEKDFFEFSLQWS